MFRRNVFSCLFYSFSYFSDEFFIDVILIPSILLTFSSLFLFFLLSTTTMTQHDVHYSCVSDPTILSIDVLRAHAKMREKDEQEEDTSLKHARPPRPIDLATFLIFFHLLVYLSTARKKWLGVAERVSSTGGRAKCSVFALKYMKAGRL
jgi:hypothetical protein